MKPAAALPLSTAVLEPLAPRSSPAWVALALLLALLTACSSGPPQPDWGANAQNAAERAAAAWLTHKPKAEESQWRVMRREIARTGQLALMARAELIRCATRAASLVLEPCAAFEPLRADAAPPELAYADYLAGRLPPAQADLLAPQHQPAARAAAGDQADILATMPDPLARLVAAAVWLQTGRAGPKTIELAIDTASAQGWSRPLLAWLAVQARYAQQAGNAEQAERAKRRIRLVQSQIES